LFKSQFSEIFGQKYFKIPIDLGSIMHDLQMNIYKVVKKTAG